MKLETIKGKIKSALDKLYEEDSKLFENDLCERCINHRFAKHLEDQKFEGYFIDCEYNKSHLDGRIGPKRVSSDYGNYIDILITKRDGNAVNDLACFEIKKWNNYSQSGRNKDREILKKLTDQDHFAYKFGFYIIYGKTKGKVKLETYSRGQQYHPQRPAHLIHPHLLSINQKNKN